MSKDDFVSGLPVRKIGTTQVMELAGTIDDWTARWQDSGQAKSAHFKPEELERAPAVGGL